MSRDYPLTDARGRRNGTLSVFRNPLLDVDGNPVGRVHVQCLAAEGIVWRCSTIAVLRDGPHTDAGTVHFAGIFRGFAGESFAVTGGTGAYDNVRGHVVLSVEDGRFLRTLHLIP